MQNFSLIDIEMKKKKVEASGKNIPKTARALMYKESKKIKVVR